MEAVGFQLARPQILDKLEDLADAHVVIVDILTPDFFDFLAAAVEGIPILGPIFSFLLTAIAARIAAGPDQPVDLPAQPPPEEIPPQTIVIPLDPLRIILNEALALSLALESQLTTASSFISAAIAEEFFEVGVTVANMQAAAGAVQTAKAIRGSLTAKLIEGIRFLEDALPEPISPTI